MLRTSEQIKNEMRSLMANETMQFEIVKHVTLPLIKLLEDGTPMFLRFESAIKTADQLQATRTRKTKDPVTGKEVEAGAAMPPPDIADVTNLENGQLGQIIVNTVLRSNLDKVYPSDGYVNKCFQLKKIKTSKRYFTFEILEIRLKGAAPSNNSTTQKTAHK
jgi:hypothetical protein